MTPSTQEGTATTSNVTPTAAALPNAPYGFLTLAADNPNAAYYVRVAITTYQGAVISLPVATANPTEGLPNITFTITGIDPEQPLAPPQFFEIPFTPATGTDIQVLVVQSPTNIQKQVVLNTQGITEETNALPAGQPAPRAPYSYLLQTDPFSFSMYISLSAYESDVVDAPIDMGVINGVRQFRMNIVTGNIVPHFITHNYLAAFLTSQSGSVPQVETLSALYAPGQQIPPKGELGNGNPQPEEKMKVILNYADAD